MVCVDVLMDGGGSLSKVLGSVWRLCFAGRPSDRGRPEVRSGAFSNIRPQTGARVQIVLCVGLAPISELQLISGVGRRPGRARPAPPEFPGHSPHGEVGDRTTTWGSPTPAPGPWANPLSDFIHRTPGPVSGPWEGSSMQTPRHTRPHSNATLARRRIGWVARARSPVRRFRGRSY